MMAESTTIELHLAHSPDPDDAFMWWPLFELNNQPPALDTAPFRFVPIADDIEALNRASESCAYEITAMSCAQYARVAQRYALTACGASIGEGYGPKVVASQLMTIDELRDRSLRMAIPGPRTTAFAALQILLGGLPFDVVEMEFSEIIDAVASGEVDAGLIIHEGQLTYGDSNLHEVADLGRWWSDEFSLPLPLGVNTVRNDLDDLHGAGTIARVTWLLQQSVTYALAHRSRSLEYAMKFGRGVSMERADAFCEMYVNRWTLDFGDVGRQAVHKLLAEGAALGVVPGVAEIAVFAVSGSSNDLESPNGRD